MAYPHMYCPNCRRVNRMVVSVYLKKEDDLDPETNETLMLNYHCEYCLSFIAQLPYEGSEEKERVVYFEFQPSYQEA